MTRRVVEGQTTWFADLELADLPPLPKGMSLHSREHELGIEVDGVVGAVPLLNGETLHIVPKMGEVNFLRLLFKAEGAQDDLDREFEEFVTYSLNADETVEAIVARQLFHSADEVMRRSPLFRRQKVRRMGVFAAGQIDVAATALGTAQRLQNPVAYFASDRTHDVPENRIITEAIWRAWPFLLDADRDGFRDVHDRWIQRLPRSRDIASDLEQIEQGFASGRYGGARDYYRRTLMLAQVILGSAGLGLSEGAGVYGDAVLLNSADVFERYIRNCIREASASAAYVVSKGGSSQAISLYVDGSFGMEPDVVIEKGGKVILIADAKYKEPTAGDHYQMTAYLAAYGVKLGVLLAASDGNKLITRDYRTAGGQIVKEIYLPMRDLDATEAFLATAVELA